MSVTRNMVYSDGSSCVEGEILDLKYDLLIYTDGQPELSVAVPGRFVIYTLGIGIWGPHDVAMSAIIQGF